MNTDDSIRLFVNGLKLENTPVSLFTAQMIEQLEAELARLRAELAETNSNWHESVTEWETMFDSQRQRAERAEAEFAAARRSREIPVWVNESEVICSCSHEARRHSDYWLKCSRCKCTKTWMHLKF